MEDKKTNKEIRNDIFELIRVACWTNDPQMKDGILMLTNAVLDRATDSVDQYILSVAAEDNESKRARAMGLIDEIDDALDRIKDLTDDFPCDSSSISEVVEFLNDANLPETRDALNALRELKKMF